jgi:glycosyltransferase involved in cell wall biosynthesis
MVGLTTKADRQLDILYVGTLPPHQGGSSVVGDYLLQGLAGLGHRVRALAPIADNAVVQGAQFVAQHPQVTVTWFRVPYFSNVRSAGSTDAAYRAAERDAIDAMFPRLVADRNPDLVIAGRESVAWHDAFTRPERAFRSVVLIHGGSTLDSLARNTPEAGRLLEQLRSMDLVVTVARHLADRLQRMGLSKVCTIPNPVDTRRFCPAAKDLQLRRDLQIEDDSFVILHASKLTSVKRPFDLIYSASNIVRQDRRVTYLVVGDGPCRASMENACRRIGINDAFRFVGWREHRSLPRFLNLADLVVMPSESEGQSLVCLEAQACARCVLAADVPGAREIISDGKTGLLFDKGNVDDLTRKTLWAKANPDARGAIGRNARKSAQAHAAETIVGHYATTLSGVVVGRA